MTQVLVCCGVGGAGKTTTAAALGVGHALAGRRVVVLTIDPARRLADALGIEHLGNAPRAIPLPQASTLGGRLDALMLDRKATWDEVVRQHAPTPDIADRLLTNPYYRALSTRLTGGHEYMATEKLYALAHDGRWDVVIVDTPPSQHALDFFQAPDRIGRILDPRLLGALLRPSQGLLGAATRRVVDVIRRLAGDQVIGDLADFFDLVAGLSAGLRERGAEVHALLRSPACRYFLVAQASSPREHDLAAFLDVLRAQEQHFAGFLLNRTAPPLGLPEADLLAAIPEAPARTPAAAWDETTEALRQAVHRRSVRAAAHAQTAQRLARSANAPVWAVPDVDGGVTDLDGLIRLSTHLPPHPAA